MVNSGIAWIGDVPEGWGTPRAKYVFHATNTRGNEHAELLAATQAHGMYPQKFLDSVVKVSLGTDLQTFRTVHVDDFVISLRSFQGGFERSDYEGVCSPAYQTFHASCEISSLYYKFLFKCFGFISAINAITVGIREGKTINYSDFALMRLPTPPLPEQKAIAGYLDDACGKIDGLREKVEKQIAALEEYKKSVITEAVCGKVKVRGEGEQWCVLPRDPKTMKPSGVEWIGDVPEGWGTTRLKYLCKITTGDQDTQDADIDGEYPFYVRSPIVERSSKFTFDGDGILMAGDGAGAGRIFHEAHGKYAVHQRVYRMFEFKDIIMHYFWYFISMSFPRVMDGGSAQSTVPSVRLPMLQNLAFYLPPLPEQEAIAGYLDKKCAAIDATVAKCRKQLDNLAEYKKSLIYECVTGKREVA